MATVKNIIERAYAKVNGEYEALIEGSADWQTYLTVLNEAMEIWATTPYVKWQSLFNPNYVLPTPVQDEVLEYQVPNLHAQDFGNSPYDNVFIMDAGVEVARFKIVDQAQFQSAKSGSICAILGDTLYFKEMPEEYVDCNIKLPAYVMPPKYGAGSQEVNVDSDTWLVAQMAASVCDSSPVPFISRSADKYYTQAGNLMKSMKNNNRKRQKLTIKNTGGQNSRPTLSQVLGQDWALSGGGSSPSVIDGGNF